MSVVTNLMICGMECDKNLNNINIRLKDQGHKPINRVDQYGSADKNMETEILMGAFNMLPVDCFIEFLKNLNWFADIDLFIQKQDDFTFERVILFRDDN